MGTSTLDASSNFVIKKLRDASNSSSSLETNMKNICSKVCLVHDYYAEHESFPAMTDLIRRSCEAVYTALSRFTSDSQSRISEEELSLLQGALDRIQGLAEHLRLRDSFTNFLLKRRYKAQIEKDDKVLCRFIVKHSPPVLRTTGSTSPACPQAESTRTRSRPHTPIPSPSHSTCSLQAETLPLQVSRDPSVRTRNSSRQLINHPYALSSDTTLEGSASFSSSDHDPPQVRVVSPQGLETDDEGWESEVETTISCTSTQPRFKADDDMRKTVLNQEYHADMSLHDERTANHSHPPTSASSYPSSPPTSRGPGWNETAPPKTVRHSPSTTLTRKSLARELRKTSSSLSSHLTRVAYSSSSSSQDSEPPQVRIASPSGVETDGPSSEVEGEVTIRVPVQRPRIKTGDDMRNPMLDDDECRAETTILCPPKAESVDSNPCHTFTYQSSSIPGANENPPHPTGIQIKTDEDIQILIGDKKRCIETLNSNLSREQSQLIANFLQKGIQTSASPKDQPLGSNPGRPVGGGGFSDVYKGSYKGKEVCLKALRTFSQDDTDRRIHQLCKETLLWTQLRHNNVLPLYGVNDELVPHAGFCLVSPWMVNGNIMQYLARNPSHDRLTAIREVAAGIAYLHSLQIVHKDIKPQNILVDEDGHCRLADFGLSNAVAETSTLFSAIVTHSNSGGTLRYMAPELLQPTENLQPPGSSENVDIARAGDIYAYGCSAYEIVTGKLPFWNLSEVMVILQVMQFGARPSRPQDGVRCSDEVWAFIERCWQQDARARPSAQDVEASATVLQH
ncbi:serine/threonine protein kinase, AGC [Marasmius sp. AFHP31]|nr:serine/threonine protein kinase, AGC [Marasmius sp. AFHP31]